MFQKKGIPNYPAPMKNETFSFAFLLSLKQFLLLALVCVTVPFLNATNVPPMIYIVTPSSGSVFFAPATLNIAATSDDDGVVTNVSFLVNGAVATNSSNTPFLTLSNPIAGSYVFRAVATDDGGLATTSAPVSIQVISNGVAQASPLILNTGNGLFEQFVTVTNRTSETWANGVRLSVQNLSPLQRLWNATGTNAGVPFLDRADPLAPNSAISILVQYYNPLPQILPNPTHRAVPLPFARPTIIPPTIQVRPVDNGSHQLSFTSQTGRFYFIQSTENFVTWTTDPTALLATGGIMIAPKDNSGDKHFYRVVMVP